MRTETESKQRRKKVSQPTELSNSGNPRDRPLSRSLAALMRRRRMRCLEYSLSFSQSKAFQSTGNATRATQFALAFSCFVRNEALKFKSNANVLKIAPKMDLKASSLIRKISKILKGIRRCADPFIDSLTQRTVMYVKFEFKNSRR